MSRTVLAHWSKTCSTVRSESARSSANDCRRVEHTRAVRTRGTRASSERRPFSAHAVARASNSETSARSWVPCRAVRTCALRDGRICLRGSVTGNARRMSVLLSWVLDPQPVVSLDAYLEMGGGDGREATTNSTRRPRSRSSRLPDCADAAEPVSRLARSGAPSPGMPRRRWLPRWSSTGPRGSRGVSRTASSCPAIRTASSRVR